MDLTVGRDEPMQRSDCRLFFRLLRDRRTGMPAAGQGSADNVSARVRTPNVPTVEEGSPASMISCENHVGRLIEVKLVAPVTVAEIVAFEAEVTAVANRVKGRRVSCADVRQAAVLPAEVAARIEQLLSRELAHVERSALLLPPAAPTFALQLNRFVRDSGPTVRRTFVEEEEAFTWLAEVLAPNERARLRAFVIGPRAAVVPAPPARVRRSS